MTDLQSMKHSEENSRNGVERAAILLMTLGEAEAAKVLRHMGARTVQRIGSAMAQLSDVSRDEVGNVVSGFACDLENSTSLGISSDDYVRKVLVNALGENKASGIVDRILNKPSSKGLDALKWMDPRSIAEMIRLEHPQIISIVLACLDADVSAEVLSLLPETTRPDVMIRIATMDEVHPAALSELDEMVDRQLSAKTESSRSASLGGTRVAAEILNQVEAGQQAAMMHRINKIDSQLSEKIQALMFVFDSLAEMDDRSLQDLLRVIPSDRLLLAMKGAKPALREKIFRNMSQRAADTLREELDAMGKVRLSEVEAAQKEILDTARKLAEAGTISIAGSGDIYI